jgi:hypothetical protein
MHIHIYSRFLNLFLIRIKGGQKYHTYITILGNTIKVNQIPSKLFWVILMPFCEKREFSL